MLSVHKLNLLLAVCLDDRIVICNGVFSWSEDDTSVLKELVF